MKSFFPIILATLCLVMGGAIGAREQTRKSESPLTNAEVVKLVKAGFKEKTIILIIASRVPDFDLSSERMIQLKRSGVGENVIVAMLARQEGTEGPDDQAWADDPFFGNSKLDPKGTDKGSENSTNIFGSSSGSKQRNRSRGGSGDASGDTVTTGSATVRILRPPTEPGGATSSKLEKTKSLTND